MSLKRYTITSGRRGEHTITVKLTEAEAKRLGATEVGGTPAKAAKAPANKARTPANKTAKRTAAKAVKGAKTTEQTPPAPPAGVEEASDPDASE
ncbi:hypothetical protein ACUOFU_16855 [Microbacterium arabinogalactanolyticum]|uniref:hypothetical protein n=1 Tax=Microbacterium arabinogalactanolyticum TaxID=69365 RepID=UPI004044D53A